MRELIKRVKDLSGAITKDNPLIFFKALIKKKVTSLVLVHHLFKVALPDGVKNHLRYPKEF